MEPDLDDLELLPYHATSYHIIPYCSIPLNSHLHYYPLAKALGAIVKITTKLAIISPLVIAATMITLPLEAGNLPRIT